jgi:hypothetical protein
MKKLSSNTNLKIINTCILGAAVLLAGLLCWRLLQSRPKSVEQIVTQAQHDLENTYYDVNIVRTDQQWHSEMTLDTPHTVNGYDYNVSSAAAPGIFLYYGSDEFPEKTVTTKKQYYFFTKHLQKATSKEQLQLSLIKTLLSNNFSVTDPDGDLKKGLMISRDSDTCDLTSGKYNELQLVCFNENILRNIASNAKPFVDGYLKAHKDSKASEITVGDISIKSQEPGVIQSSKKAGYDIAEAVIVEGGKKHLALFYQNLEKDSLWHYVTEAHDEYGFMCGPMKANKDVRTAFYDQICLSSHGQVRLDTHNRALQ